MINNLQKIVSALVITSLLLTLLATPVLAIPQIPNQFYGQVTVGSSPAPDGIQVQAKINGIAYAITTTKSGKYGYDPVFLVPADDPDTRTKEGGVSGDTVDFFVGGASASSYTFAIGGIVNLNLTVGAVTAPSAPLSITRTTADTNNTPAFTWSAPSSAPGTVASYEVRIDAGSWTNIGKVTTYTVSTALSDGSHTFSVRAVDGLGSQGTAGSLSFTVDATPPTAPGNITRTTPGNDNIPSFSWIAATDDTSGVASYEVKIDTGSYTNIGKVTTYTHTASLSEGSHTFSVRAKDVAGNTGTAGSLAFTIDTTAPPTPSLLSPADGTKTNDTTPAFDWSDVTDTSGVNYILQIDDSPDFSSPVVSKTGLTPSQYGLTSGEALSQGTYYWKVKAIDGAGNGSAWATALSFMVDTTAPLTPALASPADGVTTDNTTPTLDWYDVSDPSGVSYRLLVDNDIDFSSPVIDQTGLSSSAYTALALPLGTYYWKVKAIDGAGNESNWSTVWSFTVGAIAPPAAPGNLRKTTADNNNTPAFAWDAVSGAASYEVKIDTDTYTNIGNVTTHTHAAALSDGSHTFYVRAKDESGNSGTAGGLGFVVDVTAPAVPGNITRTTAGNVTTPAFTWSAATDATSGVASYEVKMDTGSYANIGNVTTYTHTTALSQGSHTVYVKAKDAAGNTGTAGSLEFTIDTTAPATPALVSPDDGYKTNAATPTFDWSDVTDTSGVTYNLQIDDNSDFPSPVVSKIGLTPSQYGLASGEALSQGTYYWRVEAVDGATNESAWATARSLIIDVTPPTTPGNITRTTAGNNPTPTFTWSAATDALSGIASYEVKVDTGSYANIGNVTTYTHATALSEGSHTFSVTAKDAAGNTGTAGSLEFTIDTTAPQTPALVSPADGTKTPNITPIFDWSDVTDLSGVSYSLQVADNSNFSSLVINATGIESSTYIPAADLDDSLYYWRVKAADGAGNESAWSSAWSLRIDTTAPSTPTLVTPTDGYKTNDNIPIFDWGDVTDPSGVSYSLQVADNSNFSSPVIDATGLDGSTYTPTTLGDGTYYWRVRAADTLNNLSAWASAWSLVVDTTAPAAPAGVTRTTADNDNTPTFTWNAVSDATAGVASYEVKMDTGSYTDAGNVTTYTHTTPLSDGSHTFSVRARDGAGNTGSAASLDFAIDATPPTVPGNITQATADTDDTPTFIWSAATDATSGIDYYETRIDSGAYVGIGNVTSYTAPSPLSQGSHIFKVRAVDRTGNVGTAGSIVFAISPPLPPPPTTTPLPANFTLSNLAVSPSVVNAGVPVTVTVKISNTGQTGGDYRVELVVDNVIEDTATGTLAAGRTRTLSFSVMRNAAGSHTVAMGDLTTSFTIPPANIQISDLVVSPRTVGKGDEVRVSLRVSNSGGASGVYNIALTVGGTEETSASGILGPGVSSTILFSISRSLPGTYSVAVDGLTSSFVVVAPQIEVSIPTQSTVTEATTIATDAAGNSVSLSGDTVAIGETVTGEMEISLPVALLSGAVLDSFTDTTSGITFSGNQVTIPMRDAAGNVALNVVATTENAVGTGTTAKAKVTSLALQTQEKETDLSLDDPSLGKVAVSIEADLRKLPEGASLKVTTTKALSADARSGFELVAQEENGTIADVGAAIQIEKQNLENVSVVGEARITMKVGAEWVNKYGLDKMKVARLADDGTKEWLTPEPVRDAQGQIIIDQEGRMTFVVVSPNGLSIFSLVAVVPRPAQFVSSDLSISPEIAQPNEWVEIKAQVSNNGGQEGVYSLVLKIDGTAVDTQSITLPAGQSGWVSFFVREAEERSYQVQVEGLSGSFQVTTLLGASSVAVTNLAISPAQVNVGVAASISVTVTNLSSSSGKYDVTLQVNNIVAEVKTVFLTAQETKQVEFSLAKNIEGTYSVDVNGLSGSFIVTRLLTPATFALSNLTIEPLTVAPGKPVSVKVTLSNSGGLAGSKDVTLTIDGVTAEVQPVTVEGQGSVGVTFTVTKDVPGTYQVAVDGLTGAFTVKKPFNWLLAGGIGGGVIVLAIILVAVLVSRRRRTPPPSREPPPPLPAEKSDKQEQK